MRAAALALYVAGLLGPCLSGCLAPGSKPASHECCPRSSASEAVGAPVKDCCASGDQSQPRNTAVEVPAAATHTLPPRTPAEISLVSVHADVRATASPPLVLRI
jgi:hypothetical protein